MCVCVSVCPLPLILPLRGMLRQKKDTSGLCAKLTRYLKRRFFKNASFTRYGVICVSRQHVRPYLVFVTTEASLLVKKANEILRTTYQSVNVGGSKLALSESPSFLNFPYTPVLHIIISVMHHG